MPGNGGPYGQCRQAGGKVFHGDAPALVPAGEELIEHQAEGDIEPQGGYGAVGVEHIDIVDVPGFIQAEEHALRRQIDIGTQQIYHNGQGAGNKIEDPHRGAEKIQKPAAAFFIQHRPQAQHSGAEKAGQHQVRLPGHPVVAVQKAGRHEP